MFIFLSSVDGNFEHVKDIYASVAFDGMVTWYAPVILVSSCKVKELYFPFDIQHCDMGFGSWSHDSSQLMLVYPNDSDANQKVFTSNGVWNLNEVEVRTMHLKLECCKYPFMKIIYGLTLHRIPVFYIMNIVVPCILLSFLMLMVFCIPPESGEKISLGMSNLLAIILFQQLIAESMPPRGDEAPLIGKEKLLMANSYFIARHADSSISSLICELLVSIFEMYKVVAKD